jgi:FkbM family methyltransferase
MRSIIKSSLQLSTVVSNNMVRISKANSSRGGPTKVILLAFAFASVALMFVSTINQFSSLDPNNKSSLASLQAALEGPPKKQLGGWKIASSLATTGGDEILDNLMRKGISAEQVWEQLLKEGAAAMLPGVVMEVGVHKSHQCVQAADFGWKTHCVEPSPKSFARITTQVNERTSEATRSRITLHNVAAGPSSGGKVPFTANGGTGDHVGDHDMWTMEKSAVDIKNTGGDLIEVPSMRLDDLIRQEAGGQPVFLLKVDTQGFEASVFEGLTESIRGPKPNIHYILTEYWPKGMDFQSDKPRACVAADLLENLSAQGYTLYALGMAAHPKAPKKWAREAAKDRPLNTIRANCQWYYELEDRLASRNINDYKISVLYQLDQRLQRILTQVNLLREALVHSKQHMHQRSVPVCA